LVSETRLPALALLRQEKEGVLAGVGGSEVVESLALTSGATFGSKRT
jgi:hypothetical protein